MEDKEKTFDLEYVFGKRLFAKMSEKYPNDMLNARFFAVKMGKKEIIFFFFSFFFENQWVNSFFY